MTGGRVGCSGGLSNRPHRMPLSRNAPRPSQSLLPSSVRWIQSRPRLCLFSFFLAAPKELKVNETVLYTSVLNRCKKLILTPTTSVAFAKRYVFYSCFLGGFRKCNPFTVVIDKNIFTLAWLTRFRVKFCVSDELGQRRKFLKEVLFKRSANFWLSTDNISSGVE